MKPKFSHPWQATAAITSDDGELAVRYQDNTTGVFKNIPPAPRRLDRGAGVLSGFGCDP